MFTKLSNEEYRKLNQEEKKKYNKDENDYINQKEFNDEEELLRRIDAAGTDNHGFQIGYKLQDGDIRMLLAAQRLSSNRSMGSNGRGILLEEKYPFVMIRKI